MKKIIKYFLSFIIICSLFLISNGCGSFIDSDELKVITSIERVEEDGVAKLVITYQDETIPPDKFILPSGIDGTGIASVTTLDKENGKGKIVEITFTDKSISPVRFEINDGRSVIGIESEVNEEDNQIYMWVKYDDDTISEKFVLPKGQDGVSFIGYDYEVHEDGSQTYFFHFSQNQPDVVVEIPAPLEGNGIKNIVSSEDETDYILTINYTDGNSEEVKFSKPKPTNKWIQGSSTPNDFDGADGDYFFDTQHKDIYVKEYGMWIKVVSFSDNQTLCIVNFNLNDDDGDPVKAKMPDNSRVAYPIVKNSYFVDNGFDIPIPTREGYRFVGWYRQKIVSPINGAFTDLTPVLTDLVLYAHWEKIN